MGLESEERSKAAHEQSLRDARKRMVEIRYEWDEAVLRRAELVLRHKEAIENIRKAHQALLEAEIRGIEAHSDVVGLMARNSHIMQRLDAEKETLKQATEDASRAREEGNRLSETVQQMIESEPEKRDLFSDLCEGRTPEAIQDDIGAEEAKLECMHMPNPNVLREFEKRAEEIARLTRKMAGSTEKLNGITQEIEELRSKWEPRLDELVAQINDAFAYNFEQISCAGEIRVHKPDDFDAWALDIMVRFRYVFLLLFPITS
jgi:chromosome segregation ATPase